MPTTQISLIREHTEKIKPPRALWVSFELGRPLGAPNDAAFQTRVLTAALDLLEAPSGPTIVDHPEDEPPAQGPATLVCPVSFAQPVSDQSDVAQLSAKFKEEIALMRPWYDRSMEERKRTTVGVSGMEPEAIGSFVADFLDGDLPSSQDDESPGFQFKLATDDLKAFYFEAATARPGQKDADGETLSTWYFRETVAGKVLFSVRDAHTDSEDENLRRVVNGLLIPRVHASFSP
ncbi:MAG: hypothetical protein QF898_17325 [SAR202 cluster bacterium]|nr:hypothetical protein [SAR202 cluster bacterium]